jgi:signal transduction histidine kinase
MPNDSAADVLATRAAFLQITASDCERVRALGPKFRAFADEFVERFYAHLFSHPQTAAFLKDPELVARLKRTQKQYFESLVEGRLDAAYVDERRRIGMAHAAAGLEPQWFLGAFNQYVQHCFRYFAQHDRDLEDYVESTLSLLKFIVLDVGLALDAYFARTTEQLRTALELLAQSNAALKEYAQLVSHDLKTPLATVAGLCEECLDEFGAQVPDEARRMIDQARSRTMKMKGMIDELFAISEAAAKPSQRSRVSMRGLIDDVLERLRLELGPREIEIIVPDQLPDVYAHPGRIREVFYHLLSNAVKYMDKEPGSIRLTTELRGTNQVFCVSDNGPGIGEEDLAKIFAPFRRLQQHRDRPGSGLGLYFVKTIVEEQGGRVWADSTLGEGSRFYVALPTEKPA